jgi:sugar phosphate isomerase/epimerase
MFFSRAPPNAARRALLNLCPPFFREARALSIFFSHGVENFLDRLPEMGLLLWEMLAKMSRTDIYFNEEIAMSQEASRRTFLKTAGVAAGAALIGSSGCAVHAAEQPAAPPKKYALRFGLASYTTRKLDLEKTIAAAKRVGLTCITLKEMHMPLKGSAEATAATAKIVRDAGLDLYGGGVIYMNSEAEVDRGFDYARAAGFRMIIGVPRHELLDYVETRIKAYDIALAIHNHGPEDKLYPTAESAYDKIKGRDKRFGLCVDFGHTQRCGIRPADDVLRFADRLLDVHFKDVSESTAKGSTVEIGRGVIDIPAALEALRKINYTGIASYEYEKDADDPLPGLAESVGYVNGVMTMINRG